MNKLMSALVAGLFFALFSHTLFGQQAALQVIHNAADPAAASVDIYVNGNLFLDNFDFREATPFDSVPANAPLLIGIAPASSNGSNGNGYADTLATFGPYTLMPLTNYVILAQGVLDPSQFNTGSNGAADVAFELAVLAPAKSSSGMMTIDVAVSHGSPDAPAVDIFANGGATALLNDVPYGANTGGYLTVPAAEYVFAVAASADSLNPVASFYLDGSGLGGGAAVVFASGFLAPAGQPANAQGFGLFAALPDGRVATLTPVGTAQAQVIHNAADPAAATVDIYVDIITDTVKLDDVAFRKATGFLDLPAGYPLKITFAGPSSTDITDQVVATITTPELADGEAYHVIANGVVNPNDFVANPDMEDIAFQLFYNAGARTSASGSDVDLAVFHGSTDAPTVDVLVNGGTPPFVDGAGYGAFAPYQSVPAGDYDLNLTLDNDNVNLLYTFGADVNGLGGRAGIVVASGFLTNVTDPSANQGGEAFGLVAFLDDGTDVVLPLRTNTDVDPDIDTDGGLYGMYPVPAKEWTYVSFRLVKPQPVTVQLYDASGRMVVARNLGDFGFGDHEVALSTAGLSNGLYQMVFSTPTLRSVRKLLVAK